MRQPRQTSTDMTPVGERGTLRVSWLEGGGRGSHGRLQKTFDSGEGDFEASHQSCFLADGLERACCLRGEVDAEGKHHRLRHE